MTCVSGHLTDVHFDAAIEKDWHHPAPESLFAAPVRVDVKEVCVVTWDRKTAALNISLRKTNPSPIISSTTQSGQGRSLSGLTVIGRESTLAARCGQWHWKGIEGSKSSARVSIILREREWA
jgi:hypothetical protein